MRYRIMCTCLSSAGGRCLADGARAGRRGLCYAIERSAWLSSAPVVMARQCTPATPLTWYMPYSYIYVYTHMVVCGKTPRWVAPEVLPHRISV